LAKRTVASTALFVAAVRARESGRRNPLFRDPLASALAGSEGLAWLAESEANPASNYHRDSFPYLEVRTRYFDDWALEASRDPAVRQLVTLGAGMDTRAFRIRWPDGFRLWEVDTPELFSMKETRLRSARAVPTCERTVVEADLTSQRWADRLLESGLDKGRPVIWLAEGLFEYLDAVDVGHILERASQLSGEASRFGCEIISEGYLTNPGNRDIMRRRMDRGTPFKFGTDDPQGLFREHGWAVEGKVSALEAAISLGRTPPTRGPARLGSKPPVPGASFISAAKPMMRAGNPV
jgi:methyltransferase (TIGR00027 family)